VTLPGLDTAGISVLAFWNHLDNGGTSIDPATASNAFDTYEEYSNGIEGTISVTYTSIGARTFRARVKDDGWIICWLDDTETYNIQVSRSNARPDCTGPWDMMNDWTAARTNVSPNQDFLFQTISSIKSALSSSGESTLSRSDVGYWNYLAPDATNFTQTGKSAQTADFEVTPTSSTTLHEYYVTGTDLLDGSQTGNPCYHDRDDVNTQLVTSAEVGVLDALGDIGGSGPGVTTREYLGDGGDGMISHLIFWS